MVIIISPAKTIIENQALITDYHTLPVFRKDASVLVKELKKLTVNELAALMDINPKLAELNLES